MFAKVHGWMLLVLPGWKKRDKSRTFDHVLCGWSERAVQTENQQGEWLSSNYHAPGRTDRCHILLLTANLHNAVETLS